MRIPTVKLQHKTNKTCITVNEVVWAQDLGVGKYRDYTCISNTNAGDPDDVVKTGGTTSEIKVNEKQDDYSPSQSMNDEIKNAAEKVTIDEQKADKPKTDPELKPSTSIGSKKKTKS